MTTPVGFFQIAAERYGCDSPLGSTDEAGGSDAIFEGYLTDLIGQPVRARAYDAEHDRSIVGPRRPGPKGPWGGSENAPTPSRRAGSSETRPAASAAPRDLPAAKGPLHEGKAGGGNRPQGPVDTVPVGKLADVPIETAGEAQSSVPVEAVAPAEGGDEAAPPADFLQVPAPAAGQGEVSPEQAAAGALAPAALPVPTVGTIATVGSAATVSSIASVSGAPSTGSSATPPVPVVDRPAAPAEQPASPARPNATGRLGRSIFERIETVVTAAALGKGARRVQLIIRPAHLGTIRVEVSVHRGQVSATFKAESEAVRHVLAGGLEALRQGLQEAGLEVDRLVVLVQPDAGEGNGSGADAEQEDSDESGPGFATVPPDEAPGEADSAVPGRPHALLDLRV